MKKIIIYLLFLLLIAIGGLFYIYFDPCGWVLKPTVQLIFYCVTTGLLGGVIRCLRGVYVSKALDKWDDKWVLWYYLRPIVSGIMGFISFVFIRAGLLIFSNQQGTLLKDSFFGYLVVAFLAGYNVKYFLEKIEEIGITTWGIKKTGSYNTTKPGDETQKSGDETQKSGSEYHEPGSEK